MNRSEVTNDEWESAVWKKESEEVTKWMEDLRIFGPCDDIRIVTVDRGDSEVTTIIVSDSSEGDAFIIRTNMCADTLDEAVEGVWHDSDVCRAIARLHHNAVNARQSS